MKANAPEKIYIPITEGQEIAINEWGSIPLSQYEHKRVVENIEYTRTDVFIEKACELLAKMVCEVTYEDLEGNSAQHYDKMEFIEDYKKYLKGE